MKSNLIYSVAIYFPGKELAGKARQMFGVIKELYKALAGKIPKDQYYRFV